LLLAANKRLNVAYMLRESAARSARATPRGTADGPLAASTALPLGHRTRGLCGGAGNCLPGDELLPMYSGVRLIIKPAMNIVRMARSACRTDGCRTPPKMTSRSCMSTSGTAPPSGMNESCMPLQFFGQMQVD